jgi:chemotaxis methyl-accepting protein methylase/PAS domain-containing protein
MKKSPETKGSPSPRKAATERLGPVVVGIGCSAGGLSALRAFLGHLPPHGQAAYVVVQHLDPDYRSALVELLQSACLLPVEGIRDGLRIEPGKVYVAPEGMDLTLDGAIFRLVALVRSPGARLPIDPFFRSLADALKERAVGVLLSGMGSDGIAGLRAIKKRGGFTLAQDPATAEAGDMPRGAIDAGVVDVVAVPEALAAAIAHRPPLARHPAAVVPGTDENQAREEILRLLKERSGNDFSLYKASCLNRRFERRMAVHRIKQLEEYAVYLKLNPDELDLLFREVLIGVTQFFRDPEVWDDLRDKVLPEFFARHPGGAILRAWVPACSTGEEAYSLAMVFREALALTKPAGWFSLQIFATDISRDAIEQARKGIFPEEITRSVGATRLDRYFVREEGGTYRVLASIREMVTFATHNILSDPIFSKIDILCCRNLLIYFGEALKERTLRLLCHSLNPGGFLLLGSAESIGKCGDLLVPVNRKHRIFRRVEADLKWADSPAMEHSAKARKPLVVPQADGDAEVIERVANEMIWGVLGPAAVVVNGDGDILHVRGHIEKYLESTASKTNFNIHALARGDLGKILSKAIPEAAKTSRPVFLKRVALAGKHQGSRVNVLIRAVEGSIARRDWVIVCFVDALEEPRSPSGPPEPPSDTRNLYVDLQLARDALSLARQERHSAEEELRSSNEELRAVNEELATSREELQSLNEEQLTINVELQAKVEELTGARDDLANLLNSIGIATVFLDAEMKLRRFNNAATSIFKLLPNDVGRPLSHIVSTLDYPEFASDAEDVMRSNSCIEKVVMARGNLWYRVRITPYHHHDRVDGGGVVVSFIDMTDLKKLEEELRARSGG